MSSEVQRRRGEPFSSQMEMVNCHRGSDLVPGVSIIVCCTGTKTLSVCGGCCSRAEPSVLYCVLCTVLCTYRGELFVNTQ